MSDVCPSAPANTVTLVDNYTNIRSCDSLPAHIAHTLCNKPFLKSCHGTKMAYSTVYRNLLVAENFDKFGGSVLINSSKFYSITRK